MCLDVAQELAEPMSRGRRGSTRPPSRRESRGEAMAVRVPSSFWFQPRARLCCTMRRPRTARASAKGWGMSSLDLGMPRVSLRWSGKSRLVAELRDLQRTCLFLPGPEVEARAGRCPKEETCLYRSPDLFSLGRACAMAAVLRAGPELLMLQESFQLPQFSGAD